ncbi:TPA: dTDP-4-keto-6-deoxy-D-glucose epimerase, partial [Citrobacter freundii]|nr:dTDP-4-keto-6-deoxy-D-glucose epimerase [Citrobacter freundii]
ERCIKYNDPELNILWPLSKNDRIVVSEKDKQGVGLLEIDF